MDKLNASNRLASTSRDIIFINNNICAAHFAEKLCLMKEPEISVKQNLLVLHRHIKKRVVIIKNTAYLREYFLL